MGAESSAPVRVVSAPVASPGLDEDLVALRALRPFKQLFQIPPTLPFVTPARPQLPAVSLDPAPLAALLDELHAPLRRSGAVVLDNQRVLQHNICSVEALAIRVAHGARKQRKGLGECRAHIEGVAHLEVALVESRARLASALDATERLRRMLPADVRPAPFDPEATTVFGTPPGARPDQILEAVGLALPVPIGASLLRALGAPAGVVTASALAPPSDSSDGDEGLSETDC